MQLFFAQTPPLKYHYRLAANSGAIILSKQVQNNVWFIYDLETLILILIVVGILQHQLCEGYPAESRSWSVAVGGMVCGGLIVIVVGLRIYSRITIAKKLGADDWLMLAATVVVIVLGILDVYSKPCKHIVSCTILTARRLPCKWLWSSYLEH
jgi:hypothetical protein